MTSSEMILSSNSRPILLTCHRRPIPGRHISLHSSQSIPMLRFSRKFRAFFVHTTDGLRFITLSHKAFTCLVSAFARVLRARFSLSLVVHLVFKPSGFSQKRPHQSKASRLAQNKDFV
jgi:hypothetical protein